MSAGNENGNATGEKTNGEKTYKKTASSAIKDTIQLGIHYTVGNLTSKPDRDVLMQDFYVVESVFLPREGSNLTPAHHYPDFRFKTYAPLAFRYFRELFGIKPDVYLSSLCSQPLIELSNPGASGSIFYVTSDDEFIIKTVQHKEAEFLQKLLPGYYMNLNQNPRTLLPKFYGLYCLQSGGINIRLVVMNNVLPRSMKMHYKYDLKGSTYKRRASRKEREKSTPTYKDLDFMQDMPEGIYFDLETYHALMKTLQRDCRVLESFKIMDYSLLLGIHVLDHVSKDKEGETSHYNIDNKRPSVQKVLYSTALESIQGPGKAVDSVISEDTMGGIPAKNHKGERLLLFMGIIDILQSYRLMKKLEHSWKALVYDGDTVSVHRPSFYAGRFLKFMNSKVFKKVLALRSSPSKRRCNSIPALKSSSQEILSPSNQEWSEDKNVKLAEGQSFTSLDEEALNSRHRPDLVPSTPSLFEAASLATTISSSSLYTDDQYHHEDTIRYSSRSQALQTQFGMPPKRLQQDVATRWNSTYYMLQSLLEQKRVLAAYMADYELPSMLNAHQWMLVEKILSLLAPFEQLTKEISSANASVAEVIPLISALKRLLGKESQTDHGVKTAKNILLEAVNNRFQDTDSNPLYCIATLLDPWFKEGILMQKKSSVRRK